MRRGGRVHWCFGWLSAARPAVEVGMRPNDSAARLGCAAWRAVRDPPGPQCEERTMPSKATSSRSSRSEQRHRQCPKVH